MDKTKIQQELKHNQLDGWLLYDFFGSNPISRSIAGVTQHTTRRWFIYIPATGPVVGIIPKIEASQFENVGLDKISYFATWQEMHNCLAAAVPTGSRIAMEYEPDNAIPYISRVDAGTIELVRRVANVKIQSSAKLAQIFQSRWGAEGYQSHQEATKIVYAAAQECTEFAKSELKRDAALTEYQLQKRILDNLKNNNIVGASLCIVSTGPNAGKPHYAPSAQQSSPILRENILLFDVWGKLNKPGAIFTDMTFMAYVGKAPSAEVVKVWKTVRDARIAGVTYIKSNYGKTALRGCDVDDVVREVIRSAGYADSFVHRTGHSIQTEDHANGVNIDNFETHDTRELISDIGFSIEPGIYLPEFGVRSEIVVYIHPEQGPIVTTPEQNELWML